MEFFHARLSESPDAVGWYGWYAVRRSVEGESACLIGSGGYLGPPGADGGVEIGYSIAPEHQARSFATELVAALRLHAFEDERVQRIIAHTNAANAASIRVLERSGFAPVGPGGEPGIVRYECVRTAL
jgi:[ribosomal protein S5]-alanine N-acetyltransferase